MSSPGEETVDTPIHLPSRPLPIAFGRRPDELTEEEAEELRAIMAAPPGSPGKLTRQTKKVPDGDPSLLR
jgi:hypothetical protein